MSIRRVGYMHRFQIDESVCDDPAWEAFKYRLQTDQMGS